MAVKIRLARIGRTKAPFYRIIAIDSRAKRSGRSLEVLGSYDACAGTMTQLHEERIQAWVAQGATETAAVKKLRATHGKAAKPLA